MSISHPLTAIPVSALRGKVRVPGDKSISHRALILASQTVGESSISGLLEGEDVLATATALRALGVTLERLEPSCWRVQGVGIGGFLEPEDIMNMSNSGTSARLLLGLLASHNFTACITGDASLRRRPMQRVIAPLRQSGAQFISRSNGRLPLTVQGSALPLPIDYALPVASAQVKSAILLAGLNTRGTTKIWERYPSRDHTERMLQSLGVPIRVSKAAEGGNIIELDGHCDLNPFTLQVPADPSSAAFPLVAGVLATTGEIVLPGVCLNPTRTGLLDTLMEMNADISISNIINIGGEPTGTLTARPSRLRGVRVPSSRAAFMIDEYPILAIAAACADGVSHFEGIAELKVKESNRLSAIAEGLSSLGVIVKTGDDWMSIEGLGKADLLRPSGIITTNMDHRIAMSFLIAGMVGSAPVTVDDDSAIATSFPDFVPLMRGLGAGFEG